LPEFSSTMKSDGGFRKYAQYCGIVSKMILKQR
jgi:hypothetical protein